MDYINGEGTTSGRNQRDFTKRRRERRQQFLCELDRSQPALSGNKSTNIVQCGLDVGLTNQATRASTGESNSTQEKGGRYQSKTSGGVQLDQAIGDLRGSRIDEAMLQVIKHMAFVELT